MDKAIQTILIAWGNRSRHLSDPTHCYYPPETPFNRLRRSPGRGTVPSAGLAEDFTDLVDVAVSRLRLKKPAHHEILWRSYVEGESDNAIAKTVVVGERYSRHEVKNIRIAAEAWVESQLDPMAELM